MFTFARCYGWAYRLGWHGQCPSCPIEKPSLCLLTSVWSGGGWGPYNPLDGVGCMVRDRKRMKWTPCGHFFSSKDCSTRLKDANHVCEYMQWWRPPSILCISLRQSLNECPHFNILNYVRIWCFYHCSFWLMLLSYTLEFAVLIVYK